MQTLIFNTTTKTVEIFFQDGSSQRFEDVPTVQVMTEFYEVRQRDMSDDRVYPIFRAPISKTNMVIKK
jgi:hypothetical protein